MIQNVSTESHGLISTQKAQDSHWELIFFYLTLANKRMNISLSCSRQNEIDLNQGLVVDKNQQKKKKREREKGRNK